MSEELNSRAMRRPLPSLCSLSLQRLKALPDHVEVLPGAYAGSVCGRRLSGKPSSTIGFERRHNTPFKIDAADGFIEFMVKDVPPAPADAAELRAWNSGHRR